MFYVRAPIAHAPPSAPIIYFLCPSSRWAARSIARLFLFPRRKFLPLDPIPRGALRHWGVACPSTALSIRCAPRRLIVVLPKPLPVRVPTVENFYLPRRMHDSFRLISLANPSAPRLHALHPWRRSLPLSIAVFLPRSVEPMPHAPIKTSVM